MPAKPKGFAVSCPKCRDEAATVRLDLNDLAVCTCSACDEEFSPQEARDLAAAELARWEAVCRWVESARLPTP
jgi:cysteine sulfinate desulfinase/cysteine desulfurase-like protein